MNNFFVIRIVRLLVIVVVSSMMFLLSPIFRSTSSFFLLNDFCDLMSLALDFFKWSMLFGMGTYP